MYINFLCEPEIAAANIETIGYSTPNSAAYLLLDEETRNSPISYPSEEIMAKAETFLVLPDEVNTLVDQLWTSLLSTSAAADEKNQNGGSGVLPIVVVLAAAVGVSLWVMVSRKKKLKPADIPEDSDEEDDDEYDDDEEEDEKNR